MLSYDEIINISKQYRYNYNKEAKSHYLIDKDTKTELTNMDNYEIMRIKAAIGLNTYMKHIQSSLPLDDLPYHNTTEQSEWEKNFYEDFQKSLSKIALNGNLSTDMVINMHPAHHHPQEHFFFAMKRNGLGYTRDCYESLMSFLLSENGKKMSDFNFSNRPSGTQTDFTWSVQEMSFAEKLNPNTPQYTQPQKPKEISEENKAQAKEFVEKLISYYRLAETDEAYQLRVESEDKNMQLVANTINHSETLSSISSGKKFINRLMAAQNLSLEGQTDYLEALISQPAVYDTILQIKNDGIHRQIKERAEQNIANGKQRGHHETKGEAGLRIANRTIANNPNFMEKATRFVTTKSNFSVEKQEDAFALSAVARTYGKIPSFTQNANGKFDITVDEELTK